MKFIVSIFLILPLVSTSIALISEGFFTHQDHPGKCVTREHIILSPGEKIKDPKEKCGEIECVSKEGFTAFYNCHGEKYDDDTIYAEYKYPERPYPECCVRKKK